MHAKPGIILSSSSLCSNKVVDAKGEKIGTIDDLMIDVDQGKIAYAVVSVGGFLGLGDKLFAVPFSALTMDTDNKCCVLKSASKETFEKAEGFDKENWPKVSDVEWSNRTHQTWGARPYWQ